MMDKEIANVNNLFEQPWWLDIVAKDSWNEVVVEENDEIIGRFPFRYSGKGNGRSIEMPTLTQTCGIWMKTPDKSVGNEHLSMKKRIIDELIDKLPTHKSLQIALDTSVDYILPFLWKGFTVTPRVSYRIENLTDIEAIYANFSKTVKKNIKSAKKKVVINQESNPKILSDIMDKTFATQNRQYPVSREMIKEIVLNCERRGQGKMFTAVDEEGNVHASSYFVFDDHVFYYLIAGSDSQYRASGAQTLILWEAIQYAATVSRVFDFEGSMVEGIETFFRRFGGNPVVYYEIRKVPFRKEVFEILKPKLKKLLGYK